MAIVWDALGQKPYNIGIDRGVLYIDHLGIPWNGLVSIEEKINDDITTDYFDDFEYLRINPNNDFEAILTAFTYPDEFLECQSIEASNTSGLFFGNQTPKTFGLSYRTFVGNGLDENSYQIHIFYNLTAFSENIEHVTHSSDLTAVNFKWLITGTPESIDGFNPTTHVILDSRYLEPSLLQHLENILYGIDAPPLSSILSAEILPYTGSSIVSPSEINDYILGSTNTEPANVIDQDFVFTDAYLPSLNDLIGIALNFNAVLLQPVSNEGFSEIYLGSGDLSPSKTEGVYYRLPQSRLNPSVHKDFYILEV